MTYTVRSGSLAPTTWPAYSSKRDFNDHYVGTRDLDAARAPNPGMQNFQQWMRANASRVPLG